MLTFLSLSKKLESTSKISVLRTENDNLYIMQTRIIFSLQCRCNNFKVWPRSHQITGGGRWGWSSRPLDKGAGPPGPSPWPPHWTYDWGTESFCLLNDRARQVGKVSSCRFGVYEDCPTPWSSVLVHLFVGFPKQCLSPVGRKSRWRGLRFEWHSQQPRSWPYDWHLGNCSCSELVHYNFHRGLDGGGRE